MGAAEWEQPGNWELQGEWALDSFAWALHNHGDGPRCAVLCCAVRLPALASEPAEALPCCCDLRVAGPRSCQKLPAGQGGSRGGEGGGVGAALPLQFHCADALSRLGTQEPTVCRPQGYKDLAMERLRRGIGPEELGLVHTILPFALPKGGAGDAEELHR